MNYKAQSYHLGRPLRMKEVDQKLSFKEIKREPSFRLYQVEENAYLYVKRYGSIVFLNCSEATRKEVYGALSDEEFVLGEELNDYFKIVVESGIDVKVDFNAIYVPELTVDTAHVILLNLAQSAAMDHWVSRTAQLMETVRKFSRELSKTGNIRLSKKKMRQFIGRTLMIKNRISESLYIFDTSDLAWNDEKLAKIDHDLAEELEIIDRHKALQHQLDTLKENLEIFNEIQQHKYSSLLEWIIILLILVEVIQLIVERLI